MDADRDTGRASDPIGFAPPFIDEATIAAVTRVLRSGWITTGPETAAFEQELRDYLEADAVVCGGSWTGLAGVVLDWFGVGPGDEVILPAYTYCATANVVLHRGATPVLIDLPKEDHRDGLNIRWEEVASRLSPKTKVIMPVDIGGWPVPCATWKNALQDWSRAAGFDAATPVQAALGRPLLLSDAAHSLGAMAERNPIGHQADITLFSFHAVKNLTTAEGGAAALSLPPAFDPAEVYRTLRSHCLHGQSKDAAAKFQASGKGQWRYDVTHPGFKCNMTDIQAAMGRVALARFSQDQAHRHALADAYDQHLADVNGLTLPARRTKDRDSADHLYVVLLSAEDAVKRDAIMEYMAADGISTNVHFPPLPMLTAYAERGHTAESAPEAIATFHRAISLPIHRQMNMADVVRVADALKSALVTVRPTPVP